MYKDYSPLQFVEKLSFVRYGGTAAELKAANIIMEDIEKAGGKAELMPFAINASEYNSHITRVTAPYELDIATVPFGMCGNIPAPGKELDLVYVSRGVAMDFLGLDDLSGSVVMVDALSLDVYKELVKRNAAVIFTIMGKCYENNDEAGMYARNLRPKFLEQGVIPTFAISAHDATELIRNGAEKLLIALDQKDGQAESNNVLAVIEGDKKPEESIVLTAHYDSLPVGPGAWDNATGSAALMGLYLHFLENKPARTLRFIWCGSEEQGLLGSKAYIAQNEQLVKDQVKFCFNFDMCGTLLGSNDIFITGGKELEDYVTQFCREVGYSADIRVKVHSSDSAPFADKGVPGVGLSRGTRSAEIHTCRDTMFPIGEKPLKENIAFAAKIISRTANCAVLPVDTGMPENMLKELDKYFQR